MPENTPGDTSVLTRLFNHNTWANLKLLDFCAGLSEEQLDATVIGSFGSIRDTLVHFVSSEVDYVNLATDRLPAVPLPGDDFRGFEALNEGVRWAGDELLGLAIAARADSLVRVTRPGEPIFEYPLAGLMVQVLNHSTEHRTQISTIITQLGIEPPALSGWKYMREMGEFRTENSNIRT
ncbi:MAG: DinB family protein [Chloroflexia bacterium]